MRTTLAAAALLAVLAAASPGTLAQGAEEVRLVATDDRAQPFAFRPMELVVRAGAMVRWVNDEAVFHTVTSTDTLEQRRPNGTFDQALSAQGATFEFTFGEAGTFHYYCKPHTGFMFGTIEVLPSEGPAAAPRAAPLGSAAALLAGLAGAALAGGRRG